MSLLDALIEDQLWMPPVFVGSPPTATLREVWICKRQDGGSAFIFGTGSQDDPYDGSNHNKLDTVLTNLPQNVMIRLGPGEFETQGGQGNGHTAVGFQPKAGWKIVGSGMFQTTLKLVNATGIGEGIPIIGASSAVDGLEVSDLTLDCNLPGQPSSTGYDYARLMVQGIGVAGNDIFVRRVRVINWGTQTPLFEYGASPRALECFPIFIGGDAIIEDCILEQPNPNNARGIHLFVCARQECRHSTCDGVEPSRPKTLFDTYNFIRRP